MLANHLPALANTAASTRQPCLFEIVISISAACWQILRFSKTDPCAEFCSSVNRNYAALAGSTETTHYPNLDHCLLVSFSWNLNFGKQSKLLQKKTENSNSESGILK